VNEKDVFILVDEALKNVLDQIRDDQWDSRVPDDLSPRQPGATLRQMVNDDAYDDAWVPEDAPLQDRLLGLTGRQPRCTILVLWDRSVVVAQLSDQDGVAFDLVHEAMLVGDAAGPVAGQRVLQRFGLADALEGSPLNVTDEGVDALYYLTVRLLPVEVLFPRVLREDELHSVRSLSVPRPASSASIDSSRRRAFFGLRSR